MLMSDVHFLDEAHQPRETWVLFYGVDEPKRHPVRARRGFGSSLAELLFDADHYRAHFDSCAPWVGHDLECHFRTDLKSDGGVDKHTARADVSSDVCVRIFGAPEVPKLHAESNVVSLCPSAL